MSAGTPVPPGSPGRDRRDAACRLCGGPSTSPFEGSPALARCLDCGAASLAVFPPREAREAGYQESYYREGGGERFLSVFERAVAGFRLLRMRAILERVPGPGAILDVGCGRGVLLELFRERGWRVVGTQLSRTAADAARRNRGVDVLCVELPEADLPKASFDVVTFFHVLEHLDAPDRYLSRAHELLVDGGLLIVEVPNFDSTGFRILGPRNFCIDYPNHLFFFTPSALKALLERRRFTVEKTSFFSLEYSPYTTLQNMLNAFPGRPNRLYRALMGNEEGLRLRREPLTWLHALLAVVLAVPAFLLSLGGLLTGRGNTMRFYCRMRPDA